MPRLRVEVRGGGALGGEGGELVLRGLGAWRTRSIVKSLLGCPNVARTGGERQRLNAGLVLERSPQEQHKAKIGREQKGSKPSHSKERARTAKGKRRKEMETETEEKA